MKGIDKRGALDRNALGIWMMLASVILLFILYAVWANVTQTGPQNKVEETFFELDGDYSLITFLRTPVIPDDGAKTTIITNLKNQGALKQDIIDPIVDKVYKNKMTYSEILDLYLLEDDRDAKGIIKVIFDSNAQDLLNIAFTKEGVRTWNLGVAYSDGSRSICGEYECYIWDPSKPTYLDVYDMVLPSKKRGTTIEVKLYFGKDSSDFSLLSMLVNLI